PRNEMSTGPPYGLACPPIELASYKLLEQFGPPQHQAKTGIAKQVVTNTVPFRQTWRAGEVIDGVEKIDRGDALGVRQIQRLAGQQFIEVPDATRRYARRSSPLQLFYGLARNSLKDPFQDQ